MRDMDPLQYNLSSKIRTSNPNNASLQVALHNHVAKHKAQQSVLCRTLHPSEACTYPSGHNEELRALKVEVCIAEMVPAEQARTKKNYPTPNTNRS